MVRLLLIGVAAFAFYKVFIAKSDLHLTGMQRVNSGVNAY